MEEIYGVYILKKRWRFERALWGSSSEHRTGVFQNKVIKKKKSGFILPPPLIRCGGERRVRSEPGYCDLLLPVECAGDHCGSNPGTMALEEKL